MPNAKRTSVGIGSDCLSFRKGISESVHQMLATLSSYRCRSTGKMRRMTASASAVEPRKGSQQMRKVAMTTEPRRKTATALAKSVSWRRMQPARRWQKKAGARYKHICLKLSASEKAAQHRSGRFVKQKCEAHKVRPRETQLY